MKKARRILVTGADGFIGSHLTEELVRQGHQVRAFVYYNSFNSWGWLDHSETDIRNAIEIVSGDIRDAYGVKQALSGCDIVFHLAALISVPFSYHSPAAYIDTNITGTLNILQAARELGVEQIIHTSSSEVYGTARFVPITEEHPLQAQSPYSASKIGADQLALSFHRSFDMPITIIRPFNTYGPRQSARAVIPTAITQIANGMRCLRLGALSPTRDFNFIDDTVRGFLAVLGSSRASGETINIGSSYEITIEDVVRLIAELMDAEIQFEAEPERLRPANSEVERLCADYNKAKDLLGWEPQFGGSEGLIRGLRETIRWFTEPENLIRYKAERYNL